MSTATLPPRTHNQAPKNEDPPRYLREQLLREAKNHRDQDMLRNGTYGKTKEDKFKGCSVGCFAYSIQGDSFLNSSIDPFSLVENHYRIPYHFLSLQEAFFETALPYHNQNLHVKFAAAIYHAPNIIIWDEIEEKLLQETKASEWHRIPKSYTYLRFGKLTAENEERAILGLADLTYACIMTNGRSFTAEPPRY